MLLDCLGKQKRAPVRHASYYAASVEHLCSSSASDSVTLVSVASVVANDKVYLLLDLIDTPARADLF